MHIFTICLADLCSNTYEISDHIDYHYDGDDYGDGDGDDDEREWGGGQYVLYDESN